MFKKTSMTWSSAIVFIVLQFVGFLNAQAGVDIDIARPDIVTTIHVVGSIVTAVGILYGRYRQGDIDLLGRKKAS